MQPSAIEARGAPDGASVCLLAALVGALCDQDRHALVERGGELFIEPSRPQGLRRARRRRMDAAGASLRGSA